MSRYQEGYLLPAGAQPPITCSVPKYETRLRFWRHAPPASPVGLSTQMSPRGGSLPGSCVPLSWGWGCFRGEQVPVGTGLSPAWGPPSEHGLPQHPSTQPVSGEGLDPPQTSPGVTRENQVPVLASRRAGGTSPAPAETGGTGHKGGRFPLSGTCQQLSFHAAAGAPALMAIASWL